MNGRFLKNFAIIGSGTFISMLVGVLTTPIITRIVDPGSYGKFSIFTLYANVAIMVLYLGLDQSLVRYFYEKDSEEYRRALLCKCVRMPFLVSLIVVVLIMTVEIFGIWHFELGTAALYLLCLYCIIQTVNRFSFLLVRLQYKAKLYSMLSIIQKIIYIALTLPILFWGRLDGVLALIIGTIFSALVCMIISITAEKGVWAFHKVKKNDCTISSKTLFAYAYPYVLSMGITTLFQAIDKIFLNFYGTYTDVGIYSSTMTLVHVFSIIQTSFNALWAPMSVEHYSKHKEDKTYYQKGNQVITIVMFLIGISLILCKDVFAILLGEKYRQAAYILPFLIFNPIMYTISETTVSGLVFMKKSKMQIIVALAACIANIIGNVLLVPKYGCQGAAISTGLSYIVFFTMRTVLSNTYFYVDFHLKKFYLLTGAICLYALYNTFIPFNSGTIIGYMGCLCLIFMLYMDTVVWCTRYAMDICKNIFNLREKYR